MSLIAFIFAGVLFTLFFALSLKKSTKGIKLFLSIVCVAFIAIFLLVTALNLLGEVNPLVLLILLLLGLVAILILVGTKLRLY